MSKSKSVEGRFNSTVEIVVIKPVYGVGVVGFVTKLADVVFPPLVRVGVGMGLVVAPRGLLPQIGEKVRVPFPEIVTRAVDNGVIVEPLPVSAFDDGYDGNSLPIPDGSVAIDVFVEAVQEECHVSGSCLSGDGEERGTFHTALFHREG